MSNARELAQLPSVPSGRRNLVTNGGMTVWQRSTSLAGVTETNGYQTADRFQFWTYSGGTYTLSKSTTAPSGFASSYKVLNTATASTVAGTGVSFRQRIEAQDLQHLEYNTSDSKAVTLSFWVRSDTTGTYAIRIYNPDSTRMITKTYSISSANTWEKKTIVFAGDTSGVINNDTGYGFELAWWLAAGTDFTSGTASGNWETYSATKEADGQTAQLNTGGEWYITGIQLEVGSVATEFEHRSYGEESALCKRYYQEMNLRTAVKGMGGVSGSGNSVSNLWTYPYPMRTQPTATTNSTAPAYYNAGWITSGSSAIIGPYQEHFAAGVSNTGIGAGTDFLWRWANGSNMYVYFDAEL